LCVASAFSEVCPRDWNLSLFVELVDVERLFLPVAASSSFLRR